MRCGTSVAVDARPLEPAGAELRALLAHVTDYLVDVVDRLPAEPVADHAGVPELLADPVLRRPPPASGRPLAELLAVLDRAAAKGLSCGHPGMMGYLPGSGLVAAAIADLVAGVQNRFTSAAFAAPGLVALEADLLRWLADLVGLPATAAGILTTGASLGTLSAMITARHAKLGADFHRGVVYLTDQTHHSVAKAVRLAGCPEDAVRVLPVDARQHLALPALTAAIRADRAAGRRPFCVVASAGTTNTGVIDPLPAIAHVAAVHGLWLHVDAAYGGFFQLTDRGRHRLRGLDRADSVVLDPHKGLFLPFGTGCLLVRDGALLRAAHSGPDPDYLQDVPASVLPDFREYGPELTRDFRGLRLWLPLHLHGVDAFRAALDEKLDLAEYAYRELAGEPSITMLGAPELTTVAFRHRAGDEATARVLHGVNAEHRVFLSSTRVAGRYTGRLCVLNHRTDHARVSEAVTTIRRHAAAVTR